MGRRSLATERREQILDAYEECILELGLARATLQDVAERARCKRQLIRHYLGNREEVLCELIRRAAARCDRRVESRLTGTTPEEIVESLLAAVASSTVDPAEGRDDRLLSELFGAAQTERAPHTELRKTTARWIDEYRGLLRAFAPDASPEEIEDSARLCVGIGFGAGTMRELGAIDDDPRWIVRTMRRAIEDLRAPRRAERPVVALPDER